MAVPFNQTDAKLLIEEFICGFVAEYPKKSGVKSLWRNPICAFADAANPRFVELKSIVAEDHLLPSDLVPNARTVIAYFLPFIEEVGRSNIGGTDASVLWAEAYVETNKLIKLLNAYLKEELLALGYLSGFTLPTAILDPEVLKSDWSHRHVAVIAGLGTFGLHNILITEKGCCGRLGTFVTDLYALPSRHLEKEYCLEKAGTPCSACVGKCVESALNPEQFNRFSCFSRCLKNGELYKNLGEAWVCGKCLVGLPCSFKG